MLPAQAVLFQGLSRTILAPILRIAVQKSDTGVRESVLRVVAVHPELLGTYGDFGNAIVLVQRALWRDIPAEIVEAKSGEPLVRGGDIYCLGGGEDGPQARSALELRSDGALASAISGGAALFAVCAGFQLIGESFTGPDGKRQQGLGILDMRTRRGPGPRAVGELASFASEDLGVDSMSRILTGFENHAGHSDLGAGVAPLGKVLRGVGNGPQASKEGAISGRVVGTYMHGPALARNPALADLLLSWIVGPLDPIEGEIEEETGSLRVSVLFGVGNGRRARRRRSLFSKRPFGLRRRSGVAGE